MTITDLFNDKILDISNKLNPPTEKETLINAKKQIKAFVQELLTTKSPVLKPEYGTTFVNDLGEIVNIYKMRFYLQKNADSIKDKYNITYVNISDVQKSGDALIGYMEVTFNGEINKTVDFQIDWKNKIFTTEAIVE